MFKYLEKLCKVINNNENEIAYKINNEYISYKDLWKKADTLATSLKGEGTSPILIYGHKSINMIISIVACLIANRTYIPIDLHIPKNRIEEIIKLAHSTLLICNEEIFVSSLKCLTIDEINNNYYYENDKYDTSKNTIAYIVFTSGSTGLPKGVPISYHNLENFIDWILKMIPNDTDNRLNVLNQASFSFDLSVADLYYSLFKGYTLIALDKQHQKDYSPIFDVLKNDKINLMVITPTFGKLLMLNQDFNENNYYKLKYIYFCGEQLEVAVAQRLSLRFPSVKIINAYGPTEATSAISGILIEKEMFEANYLPVGKISEAAVGVEIIDDEIILKGKSVFDGYLNIESENCFKDGNINCYKTGDIGKIENNLLYCFGRKDSQIKYMGYRIELGDIENNLLKIEGINEAVVVPKYDKTTGMVRNIKAFVTFSKDVSIEYIKCELSKSLPDYMIPKVIVKISEIPVNENGKYDRKKLMNL